MSEFTIGTANALRNFENEQDPHAIIELVKSFAATQAIPDARASKPDHSDTLRINHSLCDEVEDIVIAKVKGIADTGSVTDTITTLDALASIANIAHPRGVDNGADSALSVAAAKAWNEVFQGAALGLENDNLGKMVLANSARGTADSNAMKTVAAQNVLLYAERVGQNSPLARDFVAGVAVFAQDAQNAALLKDVRRVQAAMTQVPESRGFSWGPMIPVREAFV